jgi:hypothetical protein
MVKFAEISEGSVVQLGRFNKEMTKHSHKSGMVVSKLVTKIGKNVYTGVVVQTGEREKIEVQLHNIKAVLA